MFWLFLRFILVKSIKYCFIIECLVTTAVANIKNTATANTKNTATATGSQVATSCSSFGLQFFSHDATEPQTTTSKAWLTVSLIHLWTPKASVPDESSCLGVFASLRMHSWSQVSPPSQCPPPLITPLWLHRDIHLMWHLWAIIAQSASILEARCTPFPLWVLH